MFTGIASKIVLVQLAIIIAIGGIGYFYFKHTQDKIVKLEQDKTKLETAVNVQTQTIKSLESFWLQQQEQLKTLQSSLNDSESRRRNLEVKLRKMNLEAQARANRVDLENRMNAATQRAFEQLEELTKLDNKSANEIPSNIQPPPRPPKITPKVENE
jgi:chromosome segregation ATPase